MALLFIEKHSDAWESGKKSGSWSPSTEEKERSSWRLKRSLVLGKNSVMPECPVGEREEVASFSLFCRFCLH